MATIDVTDQDFQEKVIDSDKTDIVDFWAVWCGPCRQVSPVLDELGEKYSDQVTVAKVNVDDNPGIAAQYGITSIPTVYVFKDGERVATSVGAKPLHVFEQEFADYLS